ncbi:hypothetical protein COCMIDRAFT_9516 [Bipolaris oryzae ATCC 44560]|uniref:Uncharacterized protein n=1 Tax=Bipolaris oryzae ATCC 44560 TaxID=930090 RepID=W6ZA87_COCMI|nr:uncharacterized protein COCMIDRAFT_9516 [Bipolaris oryzae ATCC 44560]EUC40641.1 hypothetical protein COCMIDRAFT_9516 [Bipolaris oryzae ATCC 44560]
MKLETITADESDPLLDELMKMITELYHLLHGLYPTTREDIGSIREWLQNIANFARNIDSNTMEFSGLPANDADAQVPASDGKADDSSHGLAGHAATDFYLDAMTEPKDEFTSTSRSSWGDKTG